MNKRDIKRLFRAMDNAKRELHAAHHAHVVARNTYEQAVKDSDEARKTFANALATYGKVVIGGRLYYATVDGLRDDPVKEI